MRWEATGGPDFQKPGLHSACPAECLLRLVLGAKTSEIEDSFSVVYPAMKK